MQDGGKKGCRVGGKNFFFFKYDSEISTFQILKFFSSNPTTFFKIHNSISSILSKSKISGATKPFSASFAGISGILNI